MLLRLASRFFDVSTAYAWASRGKMIALRYPRGMEQYRDGEEVYMCLQKNTYGTPDGGCLWTEERTGMLFKHFLKQPWTITRCLMDQCLFYFTYTTEIRVEQSEDLRSGSAARTFRTAEERLVVDGVLVQEVWLVMWTDDFDMVGTDDAPMFIIQNVTKFGP